MNHLKRIRKGRRCCRCVNSGDTFKIMEAIWEDFRNRFDRLDVSPQQKELLDRRRARVREGAAQLLDWESVKGTNVAFGRFTAGGSS
jgi:hypothetical protein